MKSGDLVRFDTGAILPSYGVIVSISEDVAKVEYRDIAKGYIVETIQVKDLVKIGNK